MPPRSIRRRPQLLALAHWIAEQTGASVGFLARRPTRVGAQLVGALPGAGGLNAAADAGRSRLKAYLLLNAEPVLDAADPAAAAAALQARPRWSSRSAPSRRERRRCADVLLPIAPFTETSGTFVNAEGRVQSFHGVVKPLGDTRPAWKVLRVLGNLLGLPGFDFETVGRGARRRRWATRPRLAARLDNRSAVDCGRRARRPAAAADLERIADVPIYATDALVRRAPALQLTADARAPVAACRRRCGRSRPACRRAGARRAGAAQAVLAARLDATPGRRHRARAAGHAVTPRWARCSARSRSRGPETP